MGCVEQEGSAFGGQPQHIDAIKKTCLVAGDEVGRFDQVRSADRLFSKTQV